MSAGLVHRDLKPANVLFDCGGTRQDRRLRHCPHGQRGHAHRGRHRARHRVVHLPGAGGRAAGRAGQRRLFVRRDPLPHAHRRPAVRLDERDGARAHASRRAAACRGRRAARRSRHDSRASSPLPSRRTRRIGRRTGLPSCTSSVAATTRRRRWLRPPPRRHRCCGHAGRGAAGSGPSCRSPPSRPCCWSPAAASPSSSPTAARAGAPRHPSGLTLPKVPSVPSTTTTTTATTTTSTRCGDHRRYDRRRDRPRRPRRQRTRRPTTADTPRSATTTAPPTTTAAPATTTTGVTTTTRGGHDDRSGHHHHGRAVRALYFGTYDRAHPRNVNAIAALRDVGRRGRRTPGGRSRRRTRRRAGHLRSPSWRLLAPRTRDFDVLIVGVPGHFDVPRARRFAGGRPLVFDAVLSLENELVDVAAPLPRPLSPPRTSCAPSTSAHSACRISSSAAATRKPAYLLAARSRADGSPSFSAPTRTSSARPGRRRTRSTRCTIADASNGVVPRRGEVDRRPPSGSHRRRRDRSGGPRDRARARRESSSAAFPRVARDPGRAVFGALATGAPVITADTAAARELLADGDSAVLVSRPRARRRSPQAVEPARRATASSCAGASLRGGRRCLRERASRRVLGRQWRWPTRLVHVRRCGNRYAHSASESTALPWSSSSQAASASGQITYQPIRYGNASSSSADGEPEARAAARASRSSQTVGDTVRGEKRPRRHAEAVRQRVVRLVAARRAPAASPRAASGAARAPLRARASRRR